jgi:hypothetical protein
MNPSLGSVASLLAATVSEILTGNTRSGVWNITNRKSWKLKHGPLVSYVSTFLFFIFNSKRETENNVGEYQELEQVLVCGFLKVQGT